jgi:hypothetical protein
METEKTVKTTFRHPLGVIPLTNENVKEIILYEGYIKALNDDPTFKFQAQHTISVSAENIQQVLKAYVKSILPNSIYAILEVIRYDQVNKRDVKQDYLTSFRKKQDIITKLEPYLFRLIHDGTVGFGIASYTQHVHEEIFITPKKTMIIYTSKVKEVEALLVEEGIKEFRETPPVFLENYPTATADLRSLADLFPEEYLQFRDEKYRSEIYTKELIQLLDFQEN